MTKTITYRGVTVKMEKSEYGARPNVRQVKNLIDLSDLLRKTPPPTFKMDCYSLIHDGDALRKLPIVVYNTYEPSPREMSRLGKLGTAAAHTCGTAACAVGTAAFFGIAPAVLKRVDDWEDYGTEAFGVDDDAYRFLFSGSWAHYDDTAEGAAARILFLLTQGFDSLEGFSGWHPGYERMIERYTSFKEMPIDALPA